MASTKTNMSKSIEIPSGRVAPSRCFSCHKPGHFARDCEAGVSTPKPLPRSSSAVLHSKRPSSGDLVASLNRREGSDIGKQIKKKKPGNIEEEIVEEKIKKVS